MPLLPWCRLRGGVVTRRLETLASRSYGYPIGRRRMARCRPVAPRAAPDPHPGSIMTRSANARIAGFTFLAYIAAGLTSLALFRRAAAGEGIAAKLASIAAHPNEVGVVVLLGLVQCFSAVILGVTLYALTREQESDLAMLGLVSRVGEGVIGAFSIPATLALLWLAMANGPDQPDSTAASVLAGYLLQDTVALPATFFAVGSTAFSWVFLKGRMIPVTLAWLGVVASVLLVVGLPLRLAGWLPDQLAMLIWLPMLAFEVPLGILLITRGVAQPSPA